MSFFNRSKKQDRRRRAESKRPRRRRLLRSEPLEDRRLLTANLNLIPSGLMIFGGSGVDNDLQISYDGTFYTFSDPAEPINAVGGLVGLDTNPDPNIVTFDPTAIGGLFTQVVINHNAGNDTTTIVSFRPGNEGLDIRDDAGEGDDTVNISGDIGSAAMPVTNGVLIRGETINLGADIFTDNTNVSFGNDVDLSLMVATVTIDAGTGTVQFDGDIDGAIALDITNAGSAQFDGDVGSVTPLTSLTVNTSDLIQAAGSIETVGDVALTAATAVQLGDDILAGTSIAAVVHINIDSPITEFTNPGDTLLRVQGAGYSYDITITGDITSSVATDVTLDFDPLGKVIIGGNVSGLGSFMITDASTVDIDGVVSVEDIEINAYMLNVFGLQASAGDVDINSGSTTFDGTGGTLVSATGTINFNGTVSGGGEDLLFRNASSVSVGGATTDVDLFDARRGGGTLFTEVSVGAIDAGEIIIEADNSTILLFGDLISAGDITLIGRTEVFADISLVSGGGAGDDITIFGSVHDPGIGARTLIIDAGAGAAQNLPLPPDVGIGIGGFPFLNVRVTGGIVTLDEVAVANDIIIEGGTVNLSGFLSGPGDMIFRPRLLGGTLNIFNGPGPTPPVADMSLSGEELQFVVPGFANVIFGGPTAGAVFLFPDNEPDPITGAFNTIANTRFEAPLVVINDTINQGTDPVLFVVDQVDFNHGGTFVGTADVNIEDFGAIGTVTVNGALNQPISVVGPNSNNVNVNAPLSTIMFTGNVGHRINDFNVDALFATFPASTAIDVLGNVNFTGDVFINGGIFSTTGSVSIDGNLDLLGDTTLRIPGGQDFEVGGNVIGNGNNLVIRGRGGPINLVDVQGDVIDAGQFKVDSSGGNTAAKIALESVEATDIVLRGLEIELEGTIESTAGNLHLIGDVFLFGDTDLVNRSGVPSNFVRVDGPIDGAVDLIVDAGPGAAVFTGTIGGVTPLTNMAIFSGGINFLTVAITVTDDFSWIVGTPANGINDRLIRAGAGSIVAGNVIVLEADVVQGEIIGVNLIAPNVIVVERGAGD